MTDQERDDLLLVLRDGLAELKDRFGGLEQQVAEGFSDLRGRIDAVDAKVDAVDAVAVDLRGLIGAVDDRVSDLRHDIEDQFGLSPREATG